MSNTKLNQKDIKLLNELLNFKYITKEKYDGALKEDRWTKSTKSALNKYNYERKLYGENVVKQLDTGIDKNNDEVDFDYRDYLKGFCKFKMCCNDIFNNAKTLTGKLKTKKIRKLCISSLIIGFMLGYFINKPNYLTNLNYDNNSNDVQFLQKQSILILDELVNLNKINQKENKKYDLDVININSIDRVGSLIQNQREYLKELMDIRKECAYFVGTKNFTKEEMVALYNECIKL